ncbi:MAG TPA: dTDP-4-dehydrorhamnose 3,5-epimerase [Chitinophagaceae bacterium]|jgi:dTDP-4-dehydrorhamnose 3,5-epimerase|nr:dTDP-4-dehydrorhamnose 3,5-epimerase [Chitinophagaceae bacterium]
MKFEATSLAGSYLVSLQPFTDHRGWFARFYDAALFAEIGHEGAWVQMNHSFTAQKGTVRGLHFQYPPYGEIKLVRCIAGAVRDVIVDLRAGSPTFLHSFAAELSAENKKMLYIPHGFAHGFQALENNTELIYLHSEYYQPKGEGGLRHDDPALGLSWSLPVTELSERDGQHPLIESTFKGI